VSNQTNLHQKEGRVIMRGLITKIKEKKKGEFVAEIYSQK